MASSFWSMTAQDGYDAAYYYEAQKTFMDEAQELVDRLIAAYQTNDMHFHRDDESVEKAVWMLQMDALDALRECVCLLRENRHTVASRLFRDIIETLDLASYFHSRTQRSANDLAKWYDDKVIGHSRVREQVRQQHGEDAKGEKAKEYGSLSKFTHRTYMVLRNAYGLGAGDKIWFDWRLRKHAGVPSMPETVGTYLAVAASVAMRVVNEATACQVVASDALRDALAGTVVVELAQSK